MPQKVCFIQKCCVIFDNVNNPNYMKKLITQHSDSVLSVGLHTHTHTEKLNQSHFGDSFYSFL
jgi:hypothetical protein